MEFCLSTTDFDEDEIFDWFKRFRNDCPNGKLTRAQLRSVQYLQVPSLELFSTEICELEKMKD